MRFRTFITLFLFAVLLISIHQITAQTCTSNPDNIITRVQQVREFFSIRALESGPVILWLSRILFSLGILFTILMTIDCALNKREIYWFIVLWLLGPFGGIVYLLYFQNQVTFPFRIWSPAGSDNLNATQTRRCFRCQRSGVRLSPCDDGREVHYLCDMCRSEIELRRDLNTGDGEEEKAE